MFMISKETINSVMALREKMADPAKRAECIAGLEDMIRTKESHLARADWGTCCGNISNLVPQIESEIQMLPVFCVRVLDSVVQAFELYSFWGWKVCSLA